MTATRWGILGCGRIAGDFATGLKALPDAQLVAVGSRSQDKADAFAKANGAVRAHGSYVALVADPDVEIIYVATPHPMHAEDTLLCLEHGKAVLCEKPFTLNAAQAETVVAKAREKNLFLMEGMWSRFYPIMARLRTLLKEGAIGEPRMVQADFGFRAGFDPGSRLFDPNLGGGALLDVGVYCVSLASMLLGPPTDVTGVARLGETGVDEEAAMTLRYGGGQIAVLSTAIRLNTPHDAVVWGTEGRIRIASPWWKPTRLIISRNGKADEEVHVPIEGNGFNYEAAEAARCLREGKTESTILPWQESLTVMRTLDTLRSRWGIRYPME